MLDALSFGVELCNRGVTDALCFAPLNKSALRAGGMTQADEMHWFADVLNYTGTCARIQRAGKAVDVACHVARSAERREQSSQS